MILRSILTVLFFFKVTLSFTQSTYQKDSSKISQLNKLGFDLRLNDPEKTLKLGKKAYALAQNLEYKEGVAEASRIKGIGYYYLDKTDSAMSSYLNSLSLYKESKNIIGQARVYNNIGNLYREVDYDTGLKYFKTSLRLAESANITDLIGSTYINIGIIYYRKKLYDSAMGNFDKSLVIFRMLNNQIGVVNSLQNKGVTFYALKQPNRAEHFLLGAKKIARQKHLNKVIASINLTLTDIYIAKNDFKDAEIVLAEGLYYSKLSKSVKMEHDYLLLSYQLENKRQNYKKALFYLKQAYKRDSAAFSNIESEKIGLLDAQFKFIQKEKENQIIIERQKNSTILLFASIAVSLLAFIIIFLLINHSTKQTKTNKQLKILNEEISLQKENLNKINQNLEQIIDERTKDLKEKNKKLSNYSSHLSHQIRGPIATMKGLMILEKESLIEDKEFIKEIGNCINEIDDRIININQVLNDLDAPGIIPKSVDKESDT